MYPKNRQKQFDLIVEKKHEIWRENLLMSNFFFNFAYESEKLLSLGNKRTGSFVLLSTFVTLQQKRKRLEPRTKNLNWKCRITHRKVPDIATICGTCRSERTVIILAVSYNCKYTQWCSEKHFGHSLQQSITNLLIIYYYEKTFYYWWGP